MILRNTLGLQYPNFTVKIGEDPLQNLFRTFPDTHLTKVINFIFLIINSTIAITRAQTRALQLKCQQEASALIARAIQKFLIDPLQQDNNYGDCFLCTKQDFFGTFCTECGDYGAIFGLGFIVEWTKLIVFCNKDNTIIKTCLHK